MAKSKMKTIFFLQTLVGKALKKIHAKLGSDHVRFGETKSVRLGTFTIVSNVRKWKEMQRNVLMFLVTNVLMKMHAKFSSGPFIIEKKNSIKIFEWCYLKAYRY